MSKLPEPFKDLEKYVGIWDKDTFTERYAVRVSTDYDDVKEFHDAVFARIDEIMVYIDQYDLKAMPRDAKCLMQIAMAFMDVTPAIELFHQTTVPYGFDYRRVVVEDDSLRFQK